MLFYHKYNHGPNYILPIIIFITTKLQFYFILTQQTILNNTEFTSKHCFWTKIFNNHNLIHRLIGRHKQFSKICNQSSNKGIDFRFVSQASSQWLQTPWARLPCPVSGTLIMVMVPLGYVDFYYVIHIYI